MSGRLLLLCPGQGGQHAGMFDLAAADPSAAALLRMLPVAVQSPEPSLFANRTAQPLIVAATLAMWEALRSTVPAPDLVAGYSIGELSAWSVAGAIGASETVTLAATRATLMDQCLQAHPGQAMLAIANLRREPIATIAAPHGYHVAIATGEDSCIIGGLQDCVDEVEGALVQAGARVTRLPVEIASHTRYMADAAAPFAQALEGSALNAAGTPVLSGISAARLDSRAQAVEHLSRQLRETIVWDECMDACAEAGITVALELGPGAALSRMLQARHPGIACRSVADFRSLDGIRSWLRRQCE